VIAAARGLTLLIAALVAASAWGQASPSMDDLAQLLRTGGYVIVFRHGATHADQADTDPLNPGNIAQQRQLNDKGRTDAKAVGEAFKAIGVPIGKSYSSHFYRAVETSRLIGGKDPNTTPDVSEGGLVVSPNENNRRTQALRRCSPPHRTPGPTR
jgi:histidine phosphatase superfamily protein (branch 1)